MPSGITVCIPSIPPRARLLQRALASVYAQSLLPDAVVVALDVDKRGAPDTRQRALNTVQTEWVAFLDDDDQLYPQHLARLWSAAEFSGAELAYPWFDVKDGTDPFPQFYGRPWSDAEPHQVPITFLARTEAVRAAGGFRQPVEGERDALGNRAGEDYELVLSMVDCGFKIVHLPEKTWLWDHAPETLAGEPGNTSGLPTRW